MAITVHLVVCQAQLRAVHPKRLELLSQLLRAGRLGPLHIGQRIVAHSKWAAAGGRARSIQGCGCSVHEILVPTVLFRGANLGGNRGAADRGHKAWPYALYHGLVRLSRNVGSKMRRLEVCYFLAPAYDVPLVPELQRLLYMSLACFVAASRSTGGGRLP